MPDKWNRTNAQHSYPHSYDKLRERTKSMTSKKDTVELKERIKEMKAELSRREEEEKRVKVESDKRTEEVRMEQNEDMVVNTPYDSSVPKLGTHSRNPLRDALVSSQLGAIKEEVKEFEGKIKMCVEGLLRGRREKGGELKRRGSTLEEGGENEVEEKVVHEKPVGREELEEVS